MERHHFSLCTPNKQQPRTKNQQQTMTKRRFSSLFQRSPIRTLKLIYFECGGEYYAINISQVEHILP